MPTTRLNRSSVNTFFEPFSYFLVSEIFTTSDSAKILNWLKSYKDWHLVKTGLYEQYEFSLNDINPPNQLSFLKEGQIIDELRSLFLDYLGVKLSSRAEISVHKLVSGQTIRLHNDYFPEGETNRVVIQINEAFEWDMGGLIMLFNSKDPSDIDKIIKPLHNSALGFNISPNSYHAVSKVHQGERYTLVYSFLE